MLPAWSGTVSAVLLDFASRQETVIMERDKYFDSESNALDNKKIDMVSW